MKNDVLAGNRFLVYGIGLCVENDVLARNRFLEYGTVVQYGVYRTGGTSGA